MSTIADYEAWKAKQQQSSVSAAQVVLGATDGKPDEVASDLTLANDFGKVTGGPVPPLPMVKEYRNVFQQAIEREKAKTALSSAPRLTEWLRNPENAAVARDDLQGLSWWETTLGAAGNALSRGVMRLPQSYNQWMAEEAAQRMNDQSRSFFDIVGDQASLQDQRGSTVYRKPLPNPVDLFFAGTRYAQSRIGAMLGDQRAVAEQFQQQVGQIAKRIDAIPMSPAGESGKSDFKNAPWTGDAMTDIGVFANTFAKNPGGFIAFLTETAVESAPGLAGAAAATVATRSPVVGASVMGGYSGAQERFTTPAQFFAENGIDLSTPEGAQRVIANPALMREAANRGAIRGLIIGAMDGLSGGVAGTRLAESPAGNLVLQSITQALMGGGGEAGAQLATDGKIDMKEVILEALAEFTTAPIEVAAMGGESFLSRRRKAKDAEGRRALFDELSGQAQSSALRNRMPDKFRQIVEAATANGPVENVYIPAEQFVTYFQGLGADPFALVDEFEGVTRDDLEVALAGGGDLQIPTATYAAKIAGSEHDAFLMDHMRFDPDEFTAAEAAQFNERAQDAMHEAWEVAETIRKEREELRSFEQTIYDTMVTRLREAGRSTDVATTEAMLYPAFYRVMAERSGMTVEDFMRAYPLPEVRGSIPEGIQLRDVDALNRTLAEARSRRAVGADRRKALLEFISDYGGIADVGGELKARDAAVISRGKGKKTLKLARAGVVAGMRDMFGDGKAKYSADSVARAASEAGYLLDEPEVAAYRHATLKGEEAADISPALWRAIDRELKGEPQYSANDAETREAKERETLDQIEQYLASIGASLADDDASIRAAIEKDQAGRAYGQSGPVGARGMVQFPAGGVGNGDTIIRLFEGADLSTLLHESGHYFLTVMQDLAAKGEVHASADYAAIKHWWRVNAGDVAVDAKRVMPDVEVTAHDVLVAIDNGTTGDLMKDAAIDVGMQEQFARAFEAYLMEGKAPSSELRSAFEKFRAWLISIYQRLAGLRVNVSDNVRGVFDRMLASDAEIAKALNEAGSSSPVFATADAMGLTAEEYEAFLKLRSQAEDDAKGRLLREAMAPIKRAKEKWFKEERAKVRDEVAREVNAYPFFRAIEWMGNRRWLGDGQPAEMPDIRLSKDILVARYGEGVLKTLPRGKQTVYTVDGGLDPDSAAGWFGFDSGDEMIRAMERAPRRNDAIDAETDRLLNERHGDVLNDGTVEAQALDAVHTDKRGQWIAAELKAISQIAGVDVALTAKEARATARQTIAKMRVRDAMNANRFLAAERKAADEAAQLGATLAREKIWTDAAYRRIATKARAAMRGDGDAGSVASAIDDYNARFETTQSTYTVSPQTRTSSAGREYTIPGGERTTTSLGYNDLVARLVETKRRQLLNHALYSEARKVTDEVEKAENFVAKLGKASTRERIAGAGRRDNAQVDYLAAIDELLERYDFRKISGVAEQRRGALNAFMESMKAAGRENELSIPETVLADAARKPYKTLSVDELRGVIDSLKNLEHVATRWDKLIDAQQQRAFEQVIADVNDAFEANVAKRPPGRVASRGEAVKNTARQFLDIVLNASTLLREIDGFADGGAAYRNIKAPIDEAMNRLIVRKQKAATDLEALYDVYSKDERRAMSVREQIPTISFALSKWERIAVALNTGNAGNYQRLTDKNVRGSLTDAQVKTVLASLDQRDARFVQSVWDYVGSFRTDIAARERRTTGVEPNWVEATPVEIAGITLSGGYYPIKYDPRLSSLARDDEAGQLAQSLQAGRFGKAQTRNGHIKERAQSSGRDVELDMSVLHRHVNQVIYDLELSEPVSNSWRILQDGRIRGAFIDAGKQPDFEALETWLKDVAEGELRSADFVGRASRVLKSNFTAAKLAFNFVTVAMQVTGLAQSMVVVGKKDFAVGVKNSFRPGVVNDIVAKSPYMATRQTTFNKDIYDFYTDPKTGPVASRWGEIKSEIIGPLSFWLMTKTQWLLVDIPTWLAGYHQGLRRYGNDEAKAIAHADDVVKRAQASGLFHDRSAVERGSVSRTARQNDVVRLFTALGSYMFAKFNVAYERTARASRVVRDEGVSAKSAGEVMSWTLDMAFLFMLEAVVTAAIKGKLPDDQDDDDKNDSWLKFLSLETAKSVVSTIPFVRDGTSVMEGFDGGGAYGGITKDAAKGILGVWRTAMSGFTDDETKKSDIKAIINATGLAAGLPATQINRAVDAEWRRRDGENVSPWEYLIGKMKK